MDWIDEGEDLFGSALDDLYDDDYEGDDEEEDDE